MKNVRLLFALALAALFAACQNDGDEGSKSNVASIVIANAVNDTITLMAGDTLHLDITTVPAGRPVSIYSTGGLNMGFKVMDVDVAKRTVVALCGGTGQIVAVAANGNGYTTALATVIVHENASVRVAPNKKIRYMYNRTSGDTRPVNLNDILLASLSPITADQVASSEVDHTNSTDFTLDAATGLLTYNTPSSAGNMSTMHADTVILKVTNRDGSSVSDSIVFRNAAYLNICYCCSAYATYGYYPFGLFDSSGSVGGWHSNNTTHSGETIGVHYILIDFKQVTEMNGLEIWRNTTDSRVIEFYYPDVPAKVIDTGTSATNGYPGWKNTDGSWSWTMWGGVDFASEPGTVTSKTFISPAPISTRYLMVKFANSNRQSNVNLTEIFPYIIQ
ncbi:MAG: hypothetical protein LBH06_10265 [Rikenellaceae bacterium]|jgi:hypothetical protein|nr:hypothetical protein [Rikenellaceae bacterium]